MTSTKDTIPNASPNPNVRHDIAIQVPAEAEVEVIPPPVTAPGLYHLHNTDKVFIVKQKIPFPFKTKVPMKSHYKILNEQGKHIFTVAQADPRFKEKKFVIDMFNTHGELILQIVQRWSEPLKPDDVDFEEMLPYYRKDQVLPTIVCHKEGTVVQRTVTAYELKEENPDPHVHVRHCNGDFLGHIWKGSEFWMIYDSNVTQKYTFPKVSIYPENTNYSENARHKLECWGDQYSCYEYYHSNGFHHDFTCDPLGIIETEININKFGIDARAEHCSCAHFPQDFTDVDKVLVLGMTLSQYCRVSSSAEKVGCICLWTCVFLSLITITGVICGFLFGFCLTVLGRKCRQVISDVG